MSSREGDINTFFLVMRRLRKTLITLVIIFAVSVLGLTLVPGPLGENGEITRMSFFHAFYFISYTATTIGFGEIPAAFSDQQRLWTTICIYLSVIGWAVFVAAVLQMAQDENLQKAIRSSRFSRRVRNLGEPFYLVCGYGETGRHICQALDNMEFRVVVLEKDPSQVAGIELQSFRSEIIELAADAANPEVLEIAGLTHKQCRGVIALTNDDDTNLAIAISARLLAPDLKVLARANTRETEANLAAFGTPHIIHPFRRFADYLSLAIQSPAAYNLLVWLTGLPGTRINRHRDPPKGHWILCGYGNFGRYLAESITGDGLPVTVIDLHPDGMKATLEAGIHWIQGDGTSIDILTGAGIADACGIIAATANDIKNLSIAVTARQLNPDVFVILRQNSTVSRPLIEAFTEDIAVVPSEIIAQECLAILTTPMLAPFLKDLYQADQQWCATLLGQLTERFGWDTPEIWSLRINLLETTALYRRLMGGQNVKLGAVQINPSRREQLLDCRVLELDRDNGARLLLPDGNIDLRLGDELLMVGTRSARRDFEFVLSNDHALQYVLTGKDLPGGWIWEKLSSLKG